MQSVKLQFLVYLSGIWRHRWSGMAVAWIVCLLGWTGVALLPDTYAAQAKVYVDTDSLMGPLLRGLTITPNTDQQVSVMLRTFTARPNLEKVVNATDPRAAKLTPDQMEQEISRLEQGIIVRPLGTKNLFSIEYTADSPQRAEAVAQSLVSTLVDSSIGDKRRDMEDAQSFLDAKISEYETSLREAEKRAAQFKQDNLEYLGQQTGEGRLEAARTALTQAQQELDLARTRRDSVAAELVGTPASVASDSTVVVINSGGAAAGGTDSSLQQRLRQEQQSLAELKARFTDDYPDVIAKKKSIEALQSEVKATKEAPATADEARPQIPNPVYQQLRLKLADEETDVALQTRRVLDATNELSRARETADKATEVQAKAADLDRDYDIMKKNDQELLERREAARMTKAEDERQQDISLRVIEAPTRMNVPVAPNRPLLNSAVLLAGIAAGIGLGIFLTISGGSFSVSEQLIEEFDLPVIGVVTAVRHSFGERRLAVPAIGVAAAVMALFVCYAGVMIEVKTSLHTAIGAAI